MTSVILRTFRIWLHKDSLWQYLVSAF